MVKFLAKFEVKTLSTTYYLVGNYGSHYLSVVIRNFTTQELNS